MKANRLWILPILLLICIITLSVYAYNQIVTKTTFTKTNIENRVTSLFNGEIQSVTEQKDSYKVTFSIDDFIYEVSASKNEGTFSDLTIVKEGTTTNTTEKEPEKEPEQEVTEEPKESEEEQEPVKEQEPEVVKPLTEKEVIDIALTQFNGEIEETEFVTTADGGYYNVEIDTEEEEVTLQIHALTGKILTVTFDD